MSFCLSLRAYMLDTVAFSGKAAWLAVFAEAGFFKTRSRHHAPGSAHGYIPVGEMP
jgi:hypothetical protein